MIAVESRGRLGNHMFQFAFGLAAAHRLGTTFAFDADLLRPRFRLGPWGAPARRAWRAARYRTARRVAPFPLVKIDPDRTPDPAHVLAGLRDGTHYAGFFQSAAYFAEVDTEVRAALRPRRRYERDFRRAYPGLLGRPYVCCHIRRTDYLQWGDGVALPASWYHRALAETGADADTPVVFVGDDPEWAKDEFGDVAGAHFEHNEDVVDLLLLMNASVVVTSNSSFGWWGAWLNEQPGSRVLAPRYWLGYRQGREWPPGVVPPEWLQIPVEP